MVIKFLQEKIEIKEIEQWFAKTDYLPHKIIRGEWSEDDPRWIEYKKTAKLKAKRLEELREWIKGLTKE